MADNQLGTRDAHPRGYRRRAAFFLAGRRVAAFLAGVRFAAFLAGLRSAAFFTGFRAAAFFRGADFFFAAVFFGAGRLAVRLAGFLARTGGGKGSIASTGGMLNVRGGGGGSGSLDSGVSSIQPPLVQPVSRSSSGDIEAPWIGLRHNQPPGMAGGSRHRAL